MVRRTLSGNPPIDVHLRPSARARRVSLRVSGLDGRVTVSFPLGYPEGRAMGFVLEKEGWIRRQLDARPDAETIRAGTEVPVEGRILTIAAAAVRSARIDGETLLAPAARPGPAVAAFLKHLARDRLTAAADRHASALGREYSRLTLRDPRSRWGSCSGQRALMFSWRLVMAPPEVLDYVAAHEVAHLAHMNHGPDFWATVRALYGDHRSERSWLRRRGPELHRFRFGD